MKKIGGVLVIIGTLLCAYAVVGRFLMAPTVFGYLPIGPFAAQSCLVFGNSLLLVGLAGKLWGK